MCSALIILIVLDEIWKTALIRKYGAVLDQVERALRDCPDHLWADSLWEVRKEHFGVWPLRRVDEKKPGRGADRLPMLQEFSAFWNVAYHTLFHVDFYLSGATLKGYTPPPPFREEEHRAGVLPNRPYTKAELMSYVAFDRIKVQETIDALTDKQATATVRRAGTSFGEFMLRTLLHTQEHASQLNLFSASEASSHAAVRRQKWGANCCGTACDGAPTSRSMRSSRPSADMRACCRSCSQGSAPSSRRANPRPLCSTSDRRTPCTSRPTVQPSSNQRLNAATPRSA